MKSKNELWLLHNLLGLLNMVLNLAEQCCQSANSTTQQRRFFQKNFKPTKSNLSL